MNLVDSNLNCAIEEIANAVQGLRAGRYTFKRGVFDLPTIDFEVTPYLWSLIVDNGKMFRGQQDQPLMIRTSFEIATRIHKNSSDLMLDDNILQEFLWDAISVINKLEVAKLSSGYDVVTRVDKADAIFTQFHSADHAIQGIVVNFSFDI